MGRASIRAGDRDNENVESWYQKTGGGHPGESEWGLGAEGSLDLRTVERLHSVGWDWCEHFGCFLWWENKDLGQTEGSYVRGVWMDRLRVKRQVAPPGCCSPPSGSLAHPAPATRLLRPHPSPSVMLLARVWGSLCPLPPHRCPRGFAPTSAQVSLALSQVQAHTLHSCPSPLTLVLSIALPPGPRKRSDT